MHRLDGKVAIITGGEGSIGMATARAFVAEGASVFLAGISEPDLKSGVAELGDKTAKHAQVGLMRTLARELAPRGIRVNTIHPGPVDNEFQHRIEVVATGADRDAATGIFDQMIPLARHAASEEIARAMMFLASDDSSFMTGATLAVDGGMSS
jgi:NAD(P)-dependent dehydrogenase (short-subunit alcohol dehydrogenase family)